MAENGWKLFNFAVNSWELAQWLEIAENGWKWLKMSVIAGNKLEIVIAGNKLEIAGNGWK